MLTKISNLFKKYILKRLKAPPCPVCGNTMHYWTPKERSCGICNNDNCPTVMHFKLNSSCVFTVCDRFQYEYGSIKDYDVNKFKAKYKKLIDVGIAIRKKYGISLLPIVFSQSDIDRMDEECRNIK